MDELLVKHFTGTGQNQPYNIAKDNNGNTYIIGNCNGIIQHDSIILNPIGIQDGFFVKYNHKGELEWIKRFGGSNSTIAVYGISISPNNLYIAIGLTFNGNISIDDVNLSSENTDIAVAIFDLNGNLITAYKLAYGPYNQIGGFLSFTQDNKILISGVFFYQAEILGNKLETPNETARQNFIAKIEKDGSNVLWVYLVEGNSAMNYVRTIKTDPNKNVYISGQFSGYIKIGDLTLYTNNYRDGFIIKLDEYGNPIWGRRFLGGSSNIFHFRHDVDDNGNSYCVGYFYTNQIIFDSTNTLQSIPYYNTNPGYSDVFIAKYSTNGTLQWVKTYGSPFNDFLYNINVKNNHFSATGCFNNTIIIDSFQLISQGQEDGFVIIGDNDGNITKAFSIKGNRKDLIIASLISDDGRKVTFTGEFFSNQLHFTSTTLTNASIHRDGFYSTYGCILSSISFIATNVSCPGGSDGELTVIPSPEGLYTYNWSNGSTSQTITNIPAGMYYVTVTDIYGCSIIGSYNLETNPVLEATYTKVDPCNDNSGSITALPYNGKSPYSYLWSNGYTTQTINNLPAGTYYCTITDNCSSTYIISVTLSNPASLTLSITTTPQSHCIANGTATANPSGGRTPYTYLWSNGGTTQTITNLAESIYYCTITDACNTIASSSGYVNRKKLTVTFENKCSQIKACTGSSTANVSGGDPPYSYQWDSYAGNQTTQTAYNLCVRMQGYYITITDSYNCTISANSGPIVRCFIEPPTPPEPPIIGAKRKIIPNITINPIPFNNKLKISFNDINDKETQIVEIFIFDISGRLIYYNKEHKATNEITLELEHLPKSSYFLRISYSSENFNKLIIKQ